MTNTPDSTLTALANGSYLPVWTLDSNPIWGQISKARAPGIGQVFSIAPAKGTTVSHLSATELRAMAASLSYGKRLTVRASTRSKPDSSGEMRCQLRMLLKLGLVRQIEPRQMSLQITRVVS